MYKKIRNRYLSFIGNFKSVANGVHILNSHYISREDMPQEAFCDLLKKLSKQADFIRIEDAVIAIKEKTHQHQKLIAFTFDDGFEECYTKIAPILSDFKTNAAFFINPGFIDGDDSYRKNFTENIIHVNKQPMTWEMVKELHRNGFLIGNHTLDHVRLVGLTSEKLHEQIIKSKNRIVEQLQHPCEYFAWTYGRNSDIDNKALDICLKSHKYIFGGDNYTKYYSFNNTVFNRRHIEGNWPISHVQYFLSRAKKYI